MGGGRQGGGESPSGEPGATPGEPGATLEEPGAASEEPVTWRVDTSGALWGAPGVCFGAGGPTGMGPQACPSPAERPRHGATHQITSSRHRPSSSSMSTAESGERRHVSASPGPGARRRRRMRRRMKSCCWGAPDPSKGSTNLRDSSSPTRGAQAGRTRDCRGRRPQFTAGQPKVARTGGEHPGSRGQGPPA